MPPNGSGAQLRATAPPRLARSAHVQRQTLPEVDWSALWLVSCSALLGGALAPGEEGEKPERGRTKGDEEEAHKKRTP